MFSPLAVTYLQKKPLPYSSILTLLRNIELSNTHFLTLFPKRTIFQLITCLSFSQKWLLGTTNYAYKAKAATSHTSPLDPICSPRQTLTESSSTGGIFLVGQRVTGVHPFLSQSSSFSKRLPMKQSDVRHHSS